MLTCAHTALVENNLVYWLAVGTDANFGNAGTHAGYITRRGIVSFVCSILSAVSLGVGI